ncbi:Uncharacterised protein [Listeria fleischmannii subsp. coloradonensis]|nr:Uncharacterised protein [Listeria fleischmannii subsp. coloradonensis]
MLMKIEQANKLIKRKIHYLHTFVEVVIRYNRLYSNLICFIIIIKIITHDRVINL